MKKSVYVAGPMSGHKYFNFPAFDQAVADLMGLPEVGRVISPADLDRAVGFDAMELPSDTDWSDATPLGFDLLNAGRRDTAAILECDAIYMIKGWETSIGAKSELAFAQWMRKEVWFEPGAERWGYLYLDAHASELGWQPLPADKPPESTILEEAQSLVVGDRQASYGPPDQDFRRTAGMWSAYLDGRLLEPLEPFEVALMMIMLKCSRESHQKKRDNWTDIAGYAQCGWVCRQVESV